MSAEDLLLFMDDIAQIVRDIWKGIKLEWTYPPGINNTWNKSNIYKKSITKESHDKITNAVENLKKYYKLQESFQNITE